MQRGWHHRSGEVDVLPSCTAGAWLWARRRGQEVPLESLPSVCLSSLLITSVEAGEELKVKNEAGYLISTTIQC